MQPRPLDASAVDIDTRVHSSLYVAGGVSNRWIEDTSGSQSFGPPTRGRAAAHVAARRGYKLLTLTSRGSIAPLPSRSNCENTASTLTPWSSVRSWAHCFAEAVCFRGIQSAPRGTCKENKVLVSLGLVLHVRSLRMSVISRVRE